MKPDKKKEFVSEDGFIAACLAIAAIVTAIDNVRIGFIPLEWVDLIRTAFQFGGIFLLVLAVGYVGNYTQAWFVERVGPTRRQKILFWVIYVAVLFFIGWVLTYSIGTRPYSGDLPSE